MDKVLKIIKREFKTKVLTKGFIVGTILGPIFLIGMIFGPAFFMNLEGERALQVEIVDESGVLFTPLTRAFDDTLSNGEQRFVSIPIEPAVYYEHREDFRQRIEEGEISILLILPQDIVNGGEITYLSRSVSEMDLIQSIRRRVNDEVNQIRLRQAGLDPGQINELTRRVGIKTIKIQKGKETEKGVGQEGVMRSVLEEKTSRIIEVLLSSSNSFSLMMGKIFGVGSAGLVQYTIWSLMSFGVFFIASASAPQFMEQVTVSPDTFFFFALFFVLGFFQFATLYAAVGAMCSTQDDVQAMSAPVTILIIIPFMVSFMVINNPTSDASQVLSMVPFFTPMLMFLRVTLVAPPAWEVIMAIGINLIAILFFVWVSSKIYRVGILLYGKRPTVPEIVRWMKYK